MKICFETPNLTYSGLYARLHASKARTLESVLKNGGHVASCGLPPAWHPKNMNKWVSKDEKFFKYQVEPNKKQCGIAQ